jgi:hypothetical protein
MDGQRFDAWTRALARGLRRRSALKTLAGAGIAGLATHGALRHLDANTCSDCGGDCIPRGGDCSRGNEGNCCGTDICILAECTSCLGKGDKTCRPGMGDCCPGLSCRDPGPGYSCETDKNPDDGGKKNKHRHKGKGNGRGHD